MKIRARGLGDVELSSWKRWKQRSGLSRAASQRDVPLPDPTNINAMAPRHSGTVRDARVCRFGFNGGHSVSYSIVKHAITAADGHAGG